MNAIALTALMVAAIRAEETEREARLFDDPFAAELAGEPGRAALAKYRAAAPAPLVPVIEVRTRWYDDALTRATAGGIRQVVILAAGMDSRAYRLGWPLGARVFEIDQPAVLEHKRLILADRAAGCERQALPCDLESDWLTPLVSAGFQQSAATCWLVEGILQYLDAAAVGRLLTSVDALSAPGSVALYDVIGLSLLSSPVVQSTLRMMQELGAPWIFGTDNPASLLPQWRANTSELSVLGNALKRWPFPAPPPASTSAPRSYVVEASKP